MNTYHKIKTIYKRDPKNMRLIFEGQWSKPEFQFLANNNWVFTEKVDGTNIRVMWDGKNVSFNGKTDRAELYKPLVKKLEETFSTEDKRELFKNMFGEEGGVCLYGEGYGRKIQSGGNYIKDGNDFVLFDIKIGNLWLERENVEDIANRLNTKIVPIVGKGTLFEAVELVKNGLISQWGDFEAEGLVCRPEVELKNRRGERVITKIKAKDFKNITN